MSPMLLILSLVPIIGFGSAGFIEVRSDKDFASKAGNLIPVVLGIFMYALTWAPERLLHFPWLSQLAFGRCMALVSVLVACSGAFVSYSRRTTTILMAIAGILVALIWMFGQRMV